MIAFRFDKKFVACLSPLMHEAPLLLFSPVITVFHNIQYLFIVSVFVGRAERKSASSTDTMKVLGGILFSGIFISYILRTALCKLNISPGCVPAVDLASYGIFNGITWSQLGLGFALGFPMQHYFLDGLIWRFSRDVNFQTSAISNAGAFSLNSLNSVSLSEKA